MFYLKVCWLCGSIMISKNRWTMSRKSDDCEVQARPLNFTDVEVNRIASLFDAGRHIDVENALTFVEGIYNDRLRVSSCVYKLNVNLGESRITMNRLILVLSIVFDEMVKGIRHHAPSNSWIRVFLDRFLTKEFGTSTVNVGDVDNSMFMDTLSHNLQSNDAIEVNCGRECNVVVSYVPHGSRHHASVCGGSSQRNARRAQLQNVVSGHGRRFLKGAHQICYGLYDVHSNCELYESCCCFLSILISLTYLENGLLHNRLLCDCEISDLVGCDEFVDLYRKVDLEISDGVSSSNYSVIYENWLKRVGCDLVVFYNDQGEDVIIYDSQTADDGFTLIRLTKKVVFL